MMARPPLLVRFACSATVLYLTSPLVGWGDEPAKTAPATGEAAVPMPEPITSIGYTNTPMLPGTPWHVHDINRPRPRVVQVPPASEPVPPPADAIVLFDGTDLSHWVKPGNSGEMFPAGWKVDHGTMEVVPKSGSIQTVDTFGDCQLHIEWSAPSPGQGTSQARGNSGVILMGKYEIQVLDSHANVTYADGQAAAIYGQYPPLVNVTRPAGEWNVYDIFFEAPRFDGEKLVRPAFVTLMHNGVLVQYHRELLGPMTHQGLAHYTPHSPAGPLLLQDHGNPTRFRNIWVRPLDLSRAP